MKKIVRLYVLRLGLLSWPSGREELFHRRRKKMMQIRVKSSLLIKRIQKLLWLQRINNRNRSGRSRWILKSKNQTQKQKMKRCLIVMKTVKKNIRA
jgi:hypothetical protein